MQLRDWRWYGVYGLTIGLIALGVRYLLTPWGYDPGFLLGFLFAQGAAALVWVDWRMALAVALLWLLGSADDLADWVRLVGVSGMVTNRPGEGLRLEVRR